MEKTITEISKELSVSRQAIHQSLDKVIDKKKLTKKGTAYVLNSSQQQAIIDYFNKNKESDTSTELSSNLMISLKEQNLFLRKELESKNQQIKELHILLLKEKETNLNLFQKEINSQEKKENKNKKTSFCKRFFTKRKE